MDTVTIVDNGITYEITGGAAYRVEADGQRTFISQLYDPNYLATNYKVVNDKLYRIDLATGALYATYPTFSETFENAKSIKDLIGPQRGWNSFTLQSPLTPTVADYNALRDAVLAGGSYIDNVVGPTNGKHHTGSQSLVCYSVAPAPGMETAKASLETTLVYYKKGDTLRYTAWYYIASNMPFGIADFEASYIESGPGLRVVLDAGVPRVELKWATKPSFYAVDRARKIPTGRWTKVQLTAKLSDQQDGTVSLLIDGRAVISGQGQTLPLADTVYDRMEIGITANNGPETTVYVDDVKLTH
jgi:hypothetical protein